MTRHFIILLLLFCSLHTYGQLHFNANLQTNHLWRGIEVADGLVITSDLNYTFLNGLVNVGFWGGTNSIGSYKEFNNHLSFNYGRFSLAFWDAYNFSPGASYNNREFFNYKANSTGRFLDAIASYRFNESFPLFLSWSTIVFGRDRNETNTSNKYSTFCYAEYPLFKQNKWCVESGIGGVFALNGSGSKSNFYGDTYGIVHVALKVTYDFKVGSYCMPLYFCGVWNPQSARAFMQVGVQLFSF